MKSALSALRARVVRVAADPVAGPLALAGLSTVLATLGWFLLTFWFFFAFLWGIPAWIGARTLWTADALANGTAEPHGVRRVAQQALVIGILELNPIAIAASVVALRTSRRP